MEKREKLYEGKAKIVYATDDPGKVIQYFKDDATAFNALKRGTILGKGVINNKMSATLFQRLAKAGIPTHYLATLSDREMLCRKLDIIKIEVISRNIVAGSLAKRTGLEEGVPIKPPIVELYYKSDPLGDPMFTEDHVRMLKLASPKEVAWLKRMALKINALLRPLLKRKGLILVDFKLEFGRHGGQALSRRRDQSRHLPAVGRRHPREARQGPLPSRPRQRRGRVPGGLPPHRGLRLVKARVLVRLKPGILDVQGASVQRALQGLGFGEVQGLRVGKVLDLELDGVSGDSARRRVEEMCARLLTNPVIEDYTVEMLG